MEKLSIYITMFNKNPPREKLITANIYNQNRNTKRLVKSIRVTNEKTSFNLHFENNSDNFNQEHLEEDTKS